MMKPRYRKAAVLVVVLAAYAGGMFLARAQIAQAEEPFEEPALLTAPPLVALKRDTTLLTRGVGWPFQQLPQVAKFGVPVPRLTFVPIPPPPFALVTVPVPPPGAPVPTAPPAALPPGWWVAPLAVGAVGTGQGALGPTAVIPEPGTLILMSTGLVLLGLRARRRRRR